MTRFYYCKRSVKYDENEYACIATYTYENYATGGYFTDGQFDIDEFDENYFRLVFEADHNIIVDGDKYPEDVEVILSDLEANHNASSVCIYAKDCIDLMLPFSFWSIADIMLILDVVSYNTPDDIQITVIFSDSKPIFEFYA